MVISWSTRLALAAVSAVVAWRVGLAAWPLSIRGLTQGAVFGALVLVPFLAPRKGFALRAVALTAGGMLIQLAALNLAQHLLAFGPLPRAIALAGTGGALGVALLAQVLIPLRASGVLWPMAAAAGLLGGLLLGYPQALALGRLPGLIAWQTLVWAALYFSPRKRLRP